MGDLPFPAIVDQRDLKTALLLNAINRSLGGVVIRGEKGTGKSTTVRGLKRVLPTEPVVAGCVFNCHPEDARRQCLSCRATDEHEVEHIDTPVVELPLGATEDRVIGSLDIERALNEGINAFEPGLLARANRGVLYIDEVNLLDDHLVDVLLDVAASGVNRVEREGVSATHPADFILVGTMNPDEGELRPQLLDRFGLQVTTETPSDPEERRAIIDITERFDRDPDAVYDQYAEVEAELRSTIETARSRLDDVRVPDELERAIVELCIDAGVEGHRGDILTTRCARTLAAYDGRETVTERDVRTAAGLALPHRLTVDSGAPGANIDQLLAATFDDEALPDGAEGGHTADSEESDRAGDRHRISRAGSRDRRGETNPVVTDAIDGLRAFLFGEGGRDHGPGERDDETSEDRAGRGDETEVRSPYDPIGAGTTVDEPDAVPFTEAFEEPETTFRTQYDDVQSRTRSDRGDVGQYVRSRPHRSCDHREVAIDATLRSAARRGTTAIDADDLRMKVREREDAALVVFAIDSSASMRAHGHIETSTDLMRILIRESAGTTDTFATVAFRDERADLVGPPTDDPREAIRRLEALPTGNRTPLAHGLYTALRLIQEERRGDPDTPATVVVLTDGRPTVAVESDPVEEAIRIAKRLVEEGVGLVVIDLDTGLAGSDVCRGLATAGDGTYLAYDELAPETRSQRIAEAIRSTG